MKGYKARILSIIPGKKNRNKQFVVLLANNRGLWKVTSVTASICKLDGEHVYIPQQNVDGILRHGSRQGIWVSGGEGDGFWVFETQRGVFLNAAGEEVDYTPTPRSEFQPKRTWNFYDDYEDMTIAEDYGNPEEKQIERMVQEWKG